MYIGYIVIGVVISMVIIIITGSYEPIIGYVVFIIVFGVVFGVIFTSLYTFWGQSHLEITSGEEIIFNLVVSYDNYDIVNPGASSSE